MDQQGIVSARGTFYYGIMEEEISTHGLADVESQILVRSWRATRESQGQHSQEYRIAYRASFFFSHTVPEWNHPHIRNASSVDCFKSSLMRDQ